MNSFNGLEMRYINTFMYCVEFVEGNFSIVQAKKKINEMLSKYFWYYHQRNLWVPFPIDVIWFFS